MAYYSHFSGSAVWSHDPYATAPSPTRIQPRVQPTVQQRSVRPALATPLTASFLPVVPQLHQHHHKHHHHQKHDPTQETNVEIALRSGEHVTAAAAGTHPPAVGTTVVIEIPPGSQERSAVRAIGVVVNASAPGDAVGGTKVLRSALASEEVEWKGVEKDENAALEWFRERARALPGFDIIAVEYQQLVEPGTAAAATWIAGEGAERRRLLVRYTAKRRRANFARLLHDGFRRFRCRVWMSPTSSGGGGSGGAQQQLPSPAPSRGQTPHSDAASNSPSSASSLVPTWDIEGELGFEGESVLPSPDLLIAASIEGSMPPSPPPSSGGSLSWADDDEEMDFTRPPPEMTLFSTAPYL